MSRSSSRFIEDSGSLKVVHGPQQHFQQKVSEVAAMAGVKMLAAGFSWGALSRRGSIANAPLPKWEQVVQLNGHGSLIRSEVTVKKQMANCRDLRDS